MGKVLARCVRRRHGEQQQVALDGVDVEPLVDLPGTYPHERSGGQDLVGEVDAVTAPAGSDESQDVEVGSLWAVAPSVRVDPAQVGEREHLHRPDARVGGAVGELPDVVDHQSTFHHDEAARDDAAGRPGVLA